MRRVPEAGNQRKNQRTTRAEGNDERYGSWCKRAREGESWRTHMEPTPRPRHCKRHHEIVRATVEMAVPPILIGGWIREYRTFETVVKLIDVVTPGIRRTRSVPQGGPCAADLFGAALDRPACRFVKLCQDMKWGLPVGGSFLGLLLFTDNCWIMAISIKELQIMTNALNSSLKQVGLHIDWSETVRCTTAHNSPTGSVHVFERIISRKPREKEFKALGAWITFHGHFTEEIAEREVAKILCTTTHALQQGYWAEIWAEVAFVVRAVSNVLVPWQLDSDTDAMHPFAGSAGSDVEKMIYVAWGDEESTESFLIRWARLLRNCRCKHKLLHADETYFARYFSWCGHIARISTRDPTRETSRMYMNKNIAWLHDMKKELCAQFHGRRFRVWRLEQMVTRCVGEKWTERAQNFVGWRKTGRNCEFDETETGGSKRFRSPCVSWVTWCCLDTLWKLMHEVVHVHMVSWQFGSFQMCRHSSCNVSEIESEISEDEEAQHNIWNKMLGVFALQEGSPVLQHQLGDWEIRRVGLSCRFVLDVIYAFTIQWAQWREKLPVWWRVLRKFGGHHWWQVPSESWEEGHQWGHPFCKVDEWQCGQVQGQNQGFR